MFSNLTLKKKFLLLLGSTAVIFLIMYFILKIFISPIQENWDTFKNEIAARETNLIHMKGEFGYGGAIHNFKNYILRRNPENYDRFKFSYQKALNSIIKYKKIRHLAQEEMESLNVIKSVFEQYNDAIAVARDLFVNGNSTDEVDKIIKINDKPALEHFDHLQRITERLIQNITKKVSASLVNISLVLLFTFILALSVIAVISWRIHHSISKSISAVTSKMGLLSKGNLSQEYLEVKTSDDIGRLGQIFNQLAKNFSHFIKISEKFLQGETGENDSKLEGEFGHSLDRMEKQAHEKKEAEETLRQERDKLSQEDWLKSNLAEISKSLQGLKNLEKFAIILLDKLSPALNAPAGAFYLKETDKKGEVSLTLIGSHAYTQRKNISDRFKLRESLVGQCAYEMKTILLTQAPEDYIQINSGLGEAPPKNIIDQPIVFEDELLAVIEFASFEEFSQKHIELLDQVSKTIGVIMKTISSSARTSELLVEAKAQSEALEQQSGELKTINEEMEEKASELRRSQEELKSEREELRATNEELEEKTEYLEMQKVENERKSKELQDAQTSLEEKASSLEKVSKYKSEFLANMSHELRTPLNSLLILSKDLADNSEGNLTESQMEDASIIHSGGNELLNLINEVLDLSKVEAGKLEIVWENTKIEYITKSIKRQFESVAKKAGLSLIVELAEGIPTEIVVDEQRTGQILKNFFSNAMKFTHKGSVTLKVDWADPETKFWKNNLISTETLAFSVIDTGIGIPEEKQKAIFDAFQQADGSTNRHYGGTGLGLTISRELAALMEGEIHLKSEKGVGSNFTLYLPTNKTIPLDEQETEAVQDVTSVKINVKQEDRELNSKPDKTSSDILSQDDRESIQKKDKILLIIEDDPSFAKILMKIAKKWGYKNLIAGKGLTGIKLAQENKPDAIILDLGLPDIDGLKVLDQLKDNPKTQSIPVHIISAREDAEASTAKGCMGFLSKPVSKDHIKKIFEELHTVTQNKNGIKEVLVVEDNRGSQLIIGKILKSEKIKTHVVSKGLEALEILKKKNFDCMILDLGLPDITGFELLDRVSNDESYTKPPVIVYTARELTTEENQRLMQYTNSIVIKGMNSPDRLLSEITLFLHTVTTSLPENQQEPIKMIRDKDQVLKDQKVLLVDDDMRNTFALSKILSKHGMKVILADNGKVALEKSQQEQDADLILMDIMMPVMDGYEAIKKIRQQDQFVDLPIIALTAKAMKGDRQKCIDTGANDYMAKPLDVDKLLTLMKVLLDGKYEKK
jgi:CheY-like chemotaxis protein/signal transduction histidine kinase